MFKNNPPWTYWLQSLTKSRTVGRKIITYQQSVFSQMNELCLHFYFIIGTWHQEFLGLILSNAQLSLTPCSIHTGIEQSCGGGWDIWWATSGLKLPFSPSQVCSGKHYSLEAKPDWNNFENNWITLISVLHRGWCVNWEDLEPFKLGKE